MPFHGEHQAGITTAAQDRMHFVAFDVKTTKRDELVALLKEWTEAAARMTAGQEAADGGAVGGSAEAPPKDTGEALDLPASALTITIGFGPSLFDGRFGLALDVYKRQATCACRRARTTRRSPCTPSATSPASASAGCPCAGRS